MPGLRHPVVLRARNRAVTAFPVVHSALKVQQQELFLTTEIGSDDVDLPTVAAEGFIVDEVVGNNTVLVAGTQLKCALVLKCNLLSGHHQATSEGWDMGSVAHQACVLEERR
jgi:lactate dehydrogenase-like 2-hydroxyacid dehydrogenase